MLRALEIDGWMTPHELEWLYATAQSMPRGAEVVEVGSWKGRSTVAICEGLRANDTARIWAIDTFGGDPDVQRIMGAFDSGAVIEEFRRNTVDYEFLKLIVSESVEAAEDFADDSLDWVFIDANHTYEAVLADILAWSQKLKEGGLLSGHDMGLPGVADAVLRSFGEIVPGPESIWTTRARPRHPAIIAARKIVHDLKTR